MTDPFSITVGAIGLAQTCAKLTKTIIAVKESFANVEVEATDAVKELSGLKAVCESVQDVCERLKKDRGHSKLSISDIGRLKELCGRLGVSVEDCREYVSKLELLFLEIFGPTNAPAGRRAVFKSATKQLFVKDRLTHIRQNISTHRSNIQSQLTAVSALYQIVHIERVEQSLATLASQNDLVQRFQAPMQSIHSVIDQLLPSVNRPIFRPSLFGNRSVQPVGQGIYLEFRRNPSNKIRSTMTALPGHLERLEEQPRLVEGSVEAPSTSAENIEQASDAKVPLSADSSSQNESVADEDSFKIYHVPYPLTSSFVGREDILIELTDFLRPRFQGCSEPRRVAVLSGLGGIGKTQLALRASLALRHSFFGVF